MKKKLIIALMLVLMASAVSAKSFHLKVRFFQDKNPEVRSFGTDQESRLSGFYRLGGENYSVVVESAEGEILFSGVIPLDLVSHGYTSNGSSIQEVENITKDLWLPYDRDGEILRIEQDGETVEQVDIPGRLCRNDGSCSSYCSGREIDPDCTCGDGTCQSSLNEEEICPKDCQGAGEGEGGEEDTGLSTALIYLVVIGLAAGLIAYLVKRVRVDE
ncbi:MAG: hypothetical protein SVV03_00315 [Candidatus Nanohaloarchaea archaeon]|nr:hypothetical protein [Candidatus Nanohaloarchaea archaeon]